MPPTTALSQRIRIARCVFAGDVVSVLRRAPARRGLIRTASSRGRRPAPVAEQVLRATACRLRRFAPWGVVERARWRPGILALAALASRSRPASSPCSRPVPRRRSPRVRLPTINPSSCLGCSACVDACPFDVLAIDRFVAVVARPSEMLRRAVLCADACPNGSLRIADGEVASERPRVGAHLESLDANEVYLAGDLTGLPLIRNALRQGASVAEHVAAAGSHGPRHPELDLVIVGAGPAGLSALLRAKELGVRAVCLEQGAFAASLRNFPRGKVVFDVPGASPLEGPLWMSEATKEELIVRWTRAVRSRAVDLREHRRVVDLARDAQGFVVRRVDSRRAAPPGSRCARRASCSRSRPPHGPLGPSPDRRSPRGPSSVSYALADARSFAGKSVLVVGLGDVAIEAAIALAHQRGTDVAISYRGAAIARGKARNVAELQALVARGRVRIVFRKPPGAGRHRGSATLRVAGRTERIACLTPSSSLLAGSPRGTSSPGPGSGSRRIAHPRKARRGPRPEDRFAGSFVRRS